VICKLVWLIAGSIIGSAYTLQYLPSFFTPNLFSEYDEMGFYPASEITTDHFRVV
jgi:hypothetical protein